MGVLVACSAGGGGGCLLRGRCQRMDEAEVRAHAMGRPSRDSANLPRWLVKAVLCVAPGGRHEEVTPWVTRGLESGVAKVAHSAAVYCRVAALSLSVRCICVASLMRFEI